MSNADLVIKDGLVVIPGTGILETDIAVEGGKISALGGEFTGRKEIIASGRYILPGIIDPHIHLGIFGDLVSEMETETRSGLLGGVTTVGCYMGGPDPYYPSFSNTIAMTEGKVSTDIFFHLGIMTPEQKEEIPRLIEELGITSFKLYMAGIPGLIPDVEDGFLYQTFETAAKIGDGIIICVHAENPSINATYRAELQKVLTDGSLADWSDTQPNFSEEEAVRRASYFAGLAGNRLYFVHISAAESIRTLAAIKSANPKIFVETTSPYLSVTKFSSKGLLAKMVPPFREDASVEALWQAIQNNIVDTIGTDNVTQTLAVKQVEKGMWGAMPGYPALGTHLPTILNYGVNQRGVSLVKVAELMSKKPAEIFGLYPQKGTIAPGSDADLVIIDLDKTVKVDHRNLGSAGDFSLFDGEELKGWPIMTIKSGQLVVKDSQLVGQSQGKFLRRSIG
ncbi:dihydroorotase [Desulfoscipio gibsoniae]|uniref:Dihydroorotase-like cyclic amidohydrolase n=1 Tax=Desulfoscipio gibsoniae DSM 7213 TaxID=767817 RepID=R4KG54_9FIRM|nr:amidohydrolase family protein [Desulfoscipio gibsoniae]AGL00647.1 dihydroorotase-like cyclic amidohydrolase [Desulfoscipio gibsoniae DSM 7213]